MRDTYSFLVWKQFRKRWLALVSLCVVILLFTAVILAPLLSNNLPLFVYGTYQEIYQKAYRELIHGVIPELTQKSEIAEQKDKLVILENKISLMDREVEEDLNPWTEKFRSAAEQGNTKKIMKLKKEMELFLDKSRMTFTKHYTFPVFASLTEIDIFFILLLIFLPPLLFLSIRLDFSLKKGLLILLLFITLLSSFRFFYKPLFMTLDYKKALKEKTIEADSVLFPLFPYGINESNLEESYQPPSVRHLLGTDGTGRDLMTRMLWGGRISLSVGFISVGIAFFIGVFLGTMAGFYRGWTDVIIMRLIEIMLCFPTFFLILAVIAFIPPSIFNIMIVIGLTSWTGIARLIRGEFLRLSNAEFITAARALGVRNSRIIFRHALPNGIAPALVQVSFGIASAILVESSLSFLGFGVTIPVPSWGGILSEARGNFYYPWLTFAPGFMIFLSVSAYNLIGEGLRDAIDPRLKQ